MNILEKKARGEPVPADLVGQQGLWLSGWLNPIDDQGSTRLVSDTSVSSTHTLLTNTSLWIVFPGETGHEAYPDYPEDATLLIATPRLMGQHDYAAVLAGEGEVVGTCRMVQPDEARPAYLAGEVQIDGEILKIDVFSTTDEERAASKGTSRAVKIRLPGKARSLLKQRHGASYYTTPPKPAASAGDKKGEEDPPF